MNQAILNSLQALVSEYKREKFTTKKLSILWKIGDLLVSNNLTNQSYFWKVQLSGIYISRAILLRGYWLRTAFTLDEVSSIRVSLSKLFSVLPYLAPKSKRFSEEEKMRLKKTILDHSMLFVPVCTKSRQRKKESITLFLQMKKALENLSDDEISKFKMKFDVKKLEELKLTIIQMLRNDVPTDANNIILGKAKMVCEKEGLHTLSNIFTIMGIAVKKTEVDSKVFQKKVFDPLLLQPFLDKMFFKNDISCFPTNS